MITVRPEIPADHAAIRALLLGAFEGPAEATLLGSLRDDGDLILSLVAEEAGSIVGHVGFSRLLVEGPGEPFPGIALAPLAVASARRGEGIGKRLVQAGHGRLVIAGESLFVVLGDAGYYGKFHYRPDLAAGFESPYPSEHLQALAFGEAPRHGRLRYPRAFAGL